jgi:hypothetical protein
VQFQEVYWMEIDQDSPGGHVLFSDAVVGVARVEVAIRPQRGSVWDGERADWPRSRVQFSDAARAVVRVEGGLGEEH